MLGGTQDARELAAQIHARFADGVDCVYSIAGRTDAPLLPPTATRRGGFGGVEGLEDYLRSAGCDAVIDATHPFAEQISRNAARACANTALPLLAFERPAWKKTTGDNWLEVESTAAAIDLLRQEDWKRAFVTTGRTGLKAFAEATDMFLLVRLFSRPAESLVLPGARLLVDRGPFTVAGEIALLREYSIEVLITKASGGAATRAKLSAARALGLPVVLVRRPPRAEQSVSSHEAALDWVEQLLRERCNAESRKGIVDPFPLAGH